MTSALSNKQVFPPRNRNRGARTGENYRNSLRDGRRVWYDGREIADMTTAPGFRGAVATLAGLYDLQHDPEFRDQMTVEWEGARISYSFFPPTVREELLAKRRNTEILSERTLGFMGRFPDFCSNLVVGLLNVSDVLGRADPRFGRNAVDYHRYCALNDVSLTHALNDQYYDRSRRILEQPDPDQILHIVGETAAGPVVRGLRNLVTLAPFSDEALVYPNRPRMPDEDEYSIAFALPLNAPGLHMICRDLYGEHADPWRLPLSARFDEIDTTLVFDDVVVPWERIFVYRNPELSNRLLTMINPPWAGYVTMIRLMKKLETFVAVAELINRWDGRAQNRGAQILIGKLIADLEVLQACLKTMETEAALTPRGFLAPATRDSYRLHGIQASDRAEVLFEDLLTSSLVLTGGERDLDHPELGPIVRRFFRCVSPDTREYLRLLALAGDMTQSSFGGRSQLYERFHMGPPDMTWHRVYRGCDRDALVTRLRAFLSGELDAEPAESPRDLEGVLAGEPG